MKRGGELKRKAPLVTRTPLRGSGPLATSKPKRATPRRETGFPASVKLAVRARAGNGDVDQAACEACAVWLGRYGGQVHHRQNRGMGGSRRRNGIQNAALACGTPDTGCHGEATRGTDEMKAMGFVLNSGQDPALESLMLHGEQGGALVWLTPEGSYSTEAPAGVTP